MVPSFLFFFSIVSFAALIYFLLNLHIGRLNRHILPLPPGPKPWPIIGNLPHLGSIPHRSFASMVLKYGSLIHLRLGSVNVIVAGSSSVAAQFLRTHDANFSSRPSRPIANHIEHYHNDIAFAPYGARWRMLKKICTVHLFSEKALDGYRDAREEEAALLTTALIASSGTRNSNPVHLGQLLDVCIANVLGRVMLGKRVFRGDDGCEDYKSQEFKEIMIGFLKLNVLFNIGDFFPWLAWLHLPKMKKLHQRFDTFFDTLIEERKINNHNDGDHGGGTKMRTDLLTKLKDEMDSEGSKFTITEIKALFLDLFAAGTETPSTVIEWAFAELIRHPYILAQAQQELDSVVGKDRLVMESDLKQLPYVQAITKEMLRLYSSPLSLPHIAKETCEINGYSIPKNSILIINLWGIGRDPTVWSDPLKFKPERFLPGNDKADFDIKGTNFEAIPFGAGRRMCTGMSLALQMVQLVTATLIHAFDWSLPEGQVPENLNMEEAGGLTLKRLSPLMVHPIPRLGQHVYCISNA